MARPLPGRGSTKIDNFLPSRLKSSTVFQKTRQARLARLIRDARPGLQRQGQGMALVTGFGAQHLEKARPAPKPQWRDPAWPQARKAPAAWQLLRLGNGGRKPLTSLKTDSPIRRLAVVGKENRSGEFLITGSRSSLAPRCRPTSRASSDRGSRSARRPRRWPRWRRHPLRRS